MSVLIRGGRVITAADDYVADIFIDGEKALTLRGAGIAREFQVIVENYIEKRFGAVTTAH